VLLRAALAWFGLKIQLSRTGAAGSPGDWFPVPVAERTTLIAKPLQCEKEAVLRWQVSSLG
jgi:hypothetical protein